MVCEYRIIKSVGAISLRNSEQFVKKNCYKIFFFVGATNFYASFCTFDGSKFLFVTVATSMVVKLVNINGVVSN